MDSLGRLHSRYIVSEGTNPTQVAAALDAVVRQELDTALHTALQEAFGVDKAVHLIRKMEHSIAMNLGEGVAAFADRWAHNLGQAAVQRLAQADEGVVTFTDWPDYLTHFIADVLQDRHRGRWHYEPLEEHVKPTTVETLDSVLRAERENLPTILARLHRMGQLEALLAHVAPETLRWLWRYLGGTPGPDTPMADDTPVLITAIRIAVRLRLWRGPAEVGEVVLHLLERQDIHASTVPGVSHLADWLQDILERYRSQAATPPLLWTPQSLAYRLADILEFLARQGLVARGTTAGPDEQVDALLEEVLSALTWADRAILEMALRRLLGAPPQPSEPTRLSGTGQEEETGPVQTIPSIVPQAQARLLIAHQAALYALLAATPRLDNLVSDWQKVLAYAAMTGAGGVDTPQTAALLVHWVAELRRVLSYVQERTGFIQALRLGHADAALDLIASSRRDTFRQAIHAWSLAAPRLDADVWQRLTRSESGSAPTPATIPLQEAGLYLLVRPMLDLRLPSLVQRAGFTPPTGPVTDFTAVLAGVVYTLAGRGDAFLQEEAGRLGGAPAPSFDGLSAWAAAQSSRAWRLLRREVAQIAVQQRIVPPSDTVVIHHETHPTGNLLLLAPEGSALWLLGRWVRHGRSPGRAIRALLAEWRTVASQPVSHVLAGGYLFPFLTRIPGIQTDTYKDGARPLARLHPAPLLPTEAGLTFSLVASILLHTWGRWLPGLARSSSVYLWEQFLQRAGTLSINAEHYHVTLDSKPLDAVLRMSGALEPVEAVPWLGRQLYFTLGA